MTQNATYLSKTSQNELIDCIGQVILDKLVAQIKESKFYSILGDECMDTSCKEQFSLCIRYVDNEFNIHEEFFRFIHCKEGLSGEGLFKIVTKAIADLDIDINDCRGQSYDGAGSIAGYKKGLSARILNINNKAIYTHCYSHRLNLAICGTVNIQMVQTVMEQIKERSYFFNFSETRSILLKSKIDQFSPESLKTKLFDPCKTRWIERIKGMDVLEECYVPIVYTLEDMHFNKNKICNSETSFKATAFLKMITSFDFLAIFMITKNLFLQTLTVTQLLQ